MEGFVKYVQWSASAFALLFVVNIIRQLLPRSKSDPPAVLHWIPFIGNAIEYGLAPYSFFTKNREKFGDVFTFKMLGKNITCYFGIDGNEFILNAKHSDLSAEEIYSPLTTPVFGSDVVYDCPNSKLMEQKKFVKFGLTQKALKDHVPRIEREVVDYVTSAPQFRGQAGTFDVSQTCSQITIFTAGRALQGDEVREKLTTEFASLYHDLDMGFSVINFILPWAPLPHNRKRDAARNRMRDIYIDIINKRRQSGGEEGFDMIWNLMNCTYKNGTPVPDHEIAHMMITLLMAGQHTSSSAITWIICHLASRPDITGELYQEQVQNLANGGRLEPLQYEDLEKLPLLRNVVRETLRVHASIHSVLRKVKKPMPVPGTDFILDTSKTLLCSPLVTALSDEFFPYAYEWDPHRWDGTKAGGEEQDDDANEVAISKGTRSPYLPFGAGRHRCIGEKFAYLNLSVIVATLIREFKFFTMDGSRTVPETDYTSLFSRPVQPSELRWERR
ncbi:Eburicol 14-alpha-demethylase-like protein [Emericellopsis cladophorae]|uniref:Eburicol 14-alpha-demethylase-like protein n=1 Tax=Emericellopsis cladophorae TaxID=2686198 RepID=A0A9Q0BAW1_9HYPO|nr:Eburicol 14-alpha-demethylase-like protein [Emericellopsis cladophorae]KAI6778071.1 Eburicol 14-alpha-demethylase-like protein [Emericellopsis cladophorae]